MFLHTWGQTVHGLARLGWSILVPNRAAVSQNGYSSVSPEYKAHRMVNNPGVELQVLFSFAQSPVAVKDQGYIKLGEERSESSDTTLCCKLGVVQGISSQAFTAAAPDIALIFVGRSVRARLRCSRSIFRAVGFAEPCQIQVFGQPQAVVRNLAKRNFRFFPGLFLSTMCSI